MKTSLFAIIKPIFLITVWILFAGYPAFTYAQISQGGEPITFRSPVAESPEQVVLPAVDIQALSGTQTAQTVKWIRTCSNPPCPNPKVVEIADFERPEGNHDEKPSAFQLHSNYPNPFNLATTLRFDLAEPVHVKLTIYDVMGREVARLADGIMQAGAHQTTWDAGSNPSGMYIMRLEAGAFTNNRTMILLK